MSVILHETQNENFNDKEDLEWPKKAAEAKAAFGIIPLAVWLTSTMTAKRVLVNNGSP